MSNYSELPIDTEFHVVNGCWDGCVIEIEGKKCVLSYAQPDMIMVVNANSIDNNEFVIFPDTRRSLEFCYYKAKFAGWELDDIRGGFHVDGCKLIPGTKYELELKICPSSHGGFDVIINCPVPNSDNIALSTGHFAIDVLKEKENEIIRIFNAYNNMQ